MLSREEAKSASHKALIPLCGYTGLEPRFEERKRLLKRADPRGDLEAAMNLNDPLGIATRYTSWKGYDYNLTQRYYDYDDIVSGFYEACTLYEPSMLSQDALSRQLTDQGHIRLESEAPSVTHSKGSEKVRERQKKLMEIEQERQNWKIRYQAANVGTPQDLESSDVLFYNEMPSSMQYDFVDVLDISALEMLIHKDDTKRPVLKKERFTADGEAVEEKKWWGGKQIQPKHDRRAVVWMLGTCPSEQVLDRLGNVIEEQILHPHLPLLFIVLAAETRFDLPQTNAAAISVTADPWGPLLTCFKAAVERARKKQLARRSRRKAKMGEKYVPSTLDNMLAMYLEKEAVVEGSKGHKLITCPSHNMALAHFLTWAEVVAGAFLKEEENMHIAQIVGRDPFDSEDSLVSDDDKDDQDVKLPKTKTLRQQMRPFLPTWSIDAIIGRVQIEADSDTKLRTMKVGLNASNEVGVIEHTEDCDPVDDYNGDDMDARTDVSALTQPTVDSVDKRESKTRGLETLRKKAVEAQTNSTKERASSFVMMRNRAKSGLKTLVNLVTGKSATGRRNVAAPSLYASDRVSGFDELTDIKSRFDDELSSAFEKEIHTMLGSFVMLHSRLDLGGQDANKNFRPYNHEMRELINAGASNEIQEKQCTMM